MKNSSEGSLALRTLENVDTKQLIPFLAANPIVRIFTNPAGKPREAVGLVRVDASADHLWSCISNLQNLPRFIQMVESLRWLELKRPGQELIRVNLRFKIAIFSARFHFVARVERKEGRMLTLCYHAGSVRDVLIRLELAPTSDCQSILLCYVRFDPDSLGWLVNMFIRNHPEIEWGIHAGSALSIVDAIRHMATETVTR